MQQLRTIKSFVKRARAIGISKQKIFDELNSKYIFDHSLKNIDLQQLFGRIAATTLEIGFGDGKNIFDLAKNFPEENFIGAEVYLPGVTALLSLLKENHLDNIRIYQEDAVSLLKQLPNSSLNRLLILFPDPWPKRRHHKRRLIQPEFIGLLQKKLLINGFLHLATDCQEYAEHSIKVIKKFSAWIRLDPIKTPDLIQNSVATKFEKLGVEAGRKRIDLVFTLCS